MKIISAILKKYPNSLGGKNILVCTHATDATVSFLKAMSSLGAKLSYATISYSKNYESIQHILQIKNLKIIKAERILEIIKK